MAEFVTLGNVSIQNWKMENFRPTLNIQTVSLVFNKNKKFKNIFTFYQAKQIIGVPADVRVHEISDERLHVYFIKNIKKVIKSSS